MGDEAATVKRLVAEGRAAVKADVRHGEAAREARARRDRVVWSLRREHDMLPGQIAEALGLTAASVKALVRMEDARRSGQRE